MQKERNCTIEFCGFMFAMNFITIHALQIFPLAYMDFIMSAAASAYIFKSAFDVILPFMIFSGYFMEHRFKKPGQRLYGSDTGQRHNFRHHHRTGRKNAVYCLLCNNRYFPDPFLSVKHS